MKIIITESQFVNLELRRNLNLLPQYIRSTYNWLNPKAFKDFDEFLERVIFSASRDYTSEFIVNKDDNYIMWELLKPIVRDIVMNQYYDEILNYYNSDN
jgi:hypothetical protein